MRTLLRRGAYLALSTVLLTGVTACDINELLDVTDPDIVTPEALSGPTGLATLRAGAIGDFAFAYAGNGGGTEGQVLISGMFTDEYMHSGTFTSRREMDRRDVKDDNGTATGVFANLQRARQSLETAAGRIQDESPDERVGELLAMAAATYNIFGENYCSGVPFSNLDDTGNLVPGEPQTTEQIFNQAVTTADAAIAGAGGDARFVNLAAIQKGRALLNLGQYAAAAAAVSGVPTDFNFQLTYSIANGQENGIYAFNAVFERWSLADTEGGNGLSFRDAMDARVPWTRSGENLGFDEVTPQFDMLKFPGRDAPADLATGTEARLIEAEAAMQTGDVTTMLAKINEVRAMYGIAAATDPGSQAARVDLLFSERAFTLFATSHRLGDLRRMIRQYGRNAEDVFPSGAYEGGSSTYGADVNFPVPFSEQNNPNFTGCINRGA